jgi:hypothetical protein
MNNHRRFPIFLWVFLLLGLAVIVSIPARSLGQVLGNSVTCSPVSRELIRWLGCAGYCGSLAEGVGVLGAVGAAGGGLVGYLIGRGRHTERVIYQAAP